MAKFVSISISGNPVVTLDSKGRATLQITAKNLSGVAFDARAVPVSLPILKPASGAVQNRWVTIDGPAELHFEKDQEKAIVVKFDVSTKDKPKPGSYQVRVDFLSVVKPDEYDSSQAISFDVPEIKKNGTNPLVWLIPVLVVLVIGIGVGAWLLLKPSGITVPDLHGETLSEALNTLGPSGLKIDQNNVQTVESKPEDSDKIIGQKPEAGVKATKEQVIEVTLGARVIAVPVLIGHPFNEAMSILGKDLAVGRTITEQNPNFAGGVVFGQDPPPGKAVKSGTTVDLQVTPQMVTVPQVIGQTLGNAAFFLSQKGLKVTSFSGDPNKTVTGQNPAAGASVPVGSPVTLSLPWNTSCGAPNCIFQGIFAQRYVTQRLAIARDLQERKAPPQ
jgi:beta-lactam-binding protein with PASTA domain